MVRCLRVACDVLECDALCRALDEYIVRALVDVYRNVVSYKFVHPMIVAAVEEEYFYLFTYQLHVKQDKT